VLKAGADKGRGQKRIGFGGRYETGAKGRTSRCAIRLDARGGIVERVGCCNIVSVQHELGLGVWFSARR